MTLDEYIDKRCDEYHLANMDSGCSCANGHPPCDFCVQGFSLTLADFILVVQAEYHDMYDTYDTQSESDAHEHYDSVMKDLF